VEWRIDDVLGLLPSDGDRQELVSLNKQYRGAVQARAGQDEREALLDQIEQRLQWHFRALRHPLPTRAELEQLALQDPGEPAA
jgi:hypothetical protein